MGSVRDFFHDVLDLAGAGGGLGPLALTMIEAQRLHALVSDVMMPRKDGHWLIAAIPATWTISPPRSQPTT